MSALENIPSIISKLMMQIEEEINASVMPKFPIVHLAQHPSLLDLGDRQVQILASISNPQVVVLGNLLSHDECDAFVELARDRMRRSTVLENSTGGSTEHHQRTSFGGFFRKAETEVVEAVEARIARLINWPVTHGEGMQILQYGIGAEYQPHHDWFDPVIAGSAPQLKRGGQRLATLVMYLNDVPAGGGTVFPKLGLEVAPQKGNAVFFSYPGNDAQCLHGGSPVIAGEKWAATKWLRENVFV